MTRAGPSAVAIVFGGGLAGAGLALADLLLPHTGSTPTPDRIAATAILVGLGALVGGLTGILPRPLRAWAFALLLAEGARRAALGPRARTMPLATYWPILTVLFAIVGERRWIRRVATPRPLLAILALGGWFFAATVQRGRYASLREIALLAALALLARAFALEPGGRLGLAVGTALILGTTLTGGHALRQDRGGDWVQATSRATLTLWWRGRPLLAPAADVDAPTDYDLRPPFFGTPLDHRSRAFFAGVDGVLLVTVDALRADAVGPRTAREPSDTPHFDALVAKGRRFTRAYSNCPISQPAVFSALSGFLPSRIAADRGGFQAAPLVTSRLETAGVETRAAFPEGMLTVREDDFDRVTLDFGATTGHRWADPSPAELTAALRPRGEGPWFAWAHLMRPHHPYTDAAPEYRRGLDMKNEAQAYRSEVRHADADLGRLLESLVAPERTLVIVTADHGEAFGEHGSHRHGSHLYEESIHVPFVVAGPGVAAGVDPTCISLVDIAPTLDHLFGLDAPSRPRYQGRSLLPLFAGLEDAGRPIEIVSEIPPLPSGLYEVASALVAPTSKLIIHERLRREQWFDLRQDPGERTNRATAEPRARAAARRRLRARQAAAGQVSDETFAAAAAGSILRQRGHRLPPAELYEFLRHGPELPERELLPWLLQVARSGHPTLAGGLGEAWAEDERPRVRRMARILRGFASSTPDERAALAELARTEPHAELLCAHYVFAHRKRHPALRGFPEPTALAPALARAAYLLDLFGVAPDPKLIDRGLADATPHVHRRAALRLAARARHALNANWLHHLIRTSEDDQIRIEAIAALAPHRGNSEVYRWLKDRLDIGSRAEQEALFEELLLHPEAASDFDVTAWHRRVDRPLFRGVGPFDRTSGRLRARDVSLPVTLHPEGTHLALFLHLEDVDYRRNRVRARIGDFTVDIIETSRDPTKPRVFWIPPGTRANRIELTILAGDPDSMRLAGVATRPARREPPRRLGTRAS